MSSNQITTQSSEDTQDVQVESVPKTTETRTYINGNFADTNNYSAHVSFLPKGTTSKAVTDMVGKFLAKSIDWNYDSNKRYLNIAFKEKEEYNAFIQHIEDFKLTDPAKYGDIKVGAYSVPEPAKDSYPRGRSPAKRGNSPRKYNGRQGKSPPKYNKSKSPSKRNTYRGRSPPKYNNSNRRDDYQDDYRRDYRPSSPRRQNRNSDNDY